VMDPHSHANYHLSFRCCNSVGKSPATNTTASVPGTNAISAAQMTRPEPAAARRQLQSLGLLPSGP